MSQVNQVTTLTVPEIVSTGTVFSSQEKCQHKNVKLYNGNNTAGLAVCLDCGALVGGL